MSLSFSRGRNSVVRVPARVMDGIPFFIALLGCVYPHDKCSFITWSPLGVFNNWVKTRSGNTPKSASFSSIESLILNGL